MKNKGAGHPSIIAEKRQANTVMNKEYSASKKRSNAFTWQTSCKN
jgi:hypothetical protein